MKPTNQDIDAICDLVHDLCGIYLDNSKDYLIESRLSKLLEDRRCNDYVDLSRRANQDSDLQREIIDAITTNETLWFRDEAPFEALRHKIIPELIDAKQGTLNPRRFRIWSAACSTGQEAYSIAMAFADVVPDFEEWDLQIDGTDISPSAVARAREGIYNNLEVSRGLSQRYQSAYFLRDGNNLKVNEVLKNVCKFEVGNLLQPFEKQNYYDIIFCRNVAIYFTRDDRQSLFTKMQNSLVRGGWLFTGAGESMFDLGKNWKPFHHCRSTCYQPNGCNGVATLAD